MSGPLPRIEYSDRVTMTGLTGGGKSTLMRHLYLLMAPPRVSIDPQGSGVTLTPGAVTFTDPRKPPETETARYVPRDPLDLDAYGALYATLRERVVDALRSGRPHLARVWIWCDEAGIVMPANRPPPEAAAVVIAGRKLAIGHGATHVRPKKMLVELLSQAHHVAIFPTGLAGDRDYIAQNIGVDRQALEAALSQIPSDVRGCVWWDLRARTLTPTILEPA